MTRKAIDERKLARSLMQHLAEAFVLSGQLSDNDLEDGATLATKLLELLDQVEIQLVTDHRDVLLGEADRYALAGKSELALMFFATFIEHSINGIISACVEKKKRLKPHVSKSIMRQVSLEGKLTWILEVLSLPPFNKQHLKWVMRISEERNAFVHYKWQPGSEESDAIDAQNKRLQELLDRAKKASNYMKKYEARCLLEGKKGKIRKAVTRPHGRP